MSKILQIQPDGDAVLLPNTSVDDFSTDMWTDFSGDSTHDIYVDTSAGVLRFYPEGGDKDLSYKEIGPAENVTVEFKIRVTLAQYTGRVFIGLFNKPDTFFERYTEFGAPPTEATDALVFLAQGPHWTPHGVPRMHSLYKKDRVANWDNGPDGYNGYVGYDYALNTDYFVKIIKQSGRGIIELWDSAKTNLLFRKDWGDIGLPTLPYLVVSDNYQGSKEGYGWTVNDQVHGYIDDLVVSWTPLSSPPGNLPIRHIEGVGDAYAERLEKQGVNIIKDMALVNVFSLHKKVAIPLFKLYVIKRRATLALDVKIDGALFGNLLQIPLGEIIAMPDEELSRKANQPIEIISELKKDISTLLISLDNAVVKAMTLESVVTSPL